MINDELKQQQGVYKVVVGSQLAISTPEINQSGRGGSGHCFSLVSYSLHVILIICNLLVGPVQLVLILSQVRLASGLKQDGICYVLLGR